MSFGSSDDCDRPDERPAGRYERTFLTGQVFRRWPGRTRSAMALVWLAFIVFPLVNAFGKHGSVLQQGLIIVGAAVFVASYVTIIVTWRGRPNRLTLPLFLLMLGVASALTVGQSSGWGFLFVYGAACAWLITSKQLGFYVVALCTVLAAAATAIAGANGGTVIGFVASTAGIGMLMLLMGDLRLRNQELSEARAELARMAVTQERERFARDLHDLLGHSLSVITLKAELAGRMLDDRPADAAREISELEQVARTALGEVREAVSGYRQPTLDRELAGARMALSAAGIEADIQQASVSLDPSVEAVLAWAVREGATNVIRHSGARHCTLRVTASLTDAGVEVIDDGVGNGAGNESETRDAGGGVSGPGVGTKTRARAGTASSLSMSAGNGLSGSTANRLSVGAGSGGHGLAGLGERARLVNGTLEAGALPGGGYRLAVTVPVSHT
jgi:two-component system, NarL family, sensor histidine kinase DesK